MPTYTYDETLPTGKDHVRLLIPDKDTTNALWSDEEIAAMLSIEADTWGHSSTCAPYFVASKLLDGQLTFYVNKYQGVSRKKVDDLELEFGGRNTSLADLRNRVASLLAEGLRCEQVNSATSLRFRAVGPRKLSTDT